MIFPKALWIKIATKLDSRLEDTTKILILIPNDKGNTHQATHGLDQKITMK